MTKGYFDFPLPPYYCPSGDGDNWEGGDYLYYTDSTGQKWRVRPHATTDGPSVPGIALSLVKKTGRQWLAGVLHDAPYRGYLEKFVDGKWIRVFLTMDEALWLFNDAMIARDVEEPTRTEFYLAVKFAAQKAYSDDMAQPIPK